MFLRHFREFDWNIGITQDSVFTFLYRILNPAQCTVGIAQDLEGKLQHSNSRQWSNTG